jgi:hypothetical protein
MRNVHQLSVEEIFCIFQYIAVFLQQAFDRSQTMVDDFRVAQGFTFLVEFGLRSVLQVFDWLVGWLIDWLIGRLIDWLIDWLVGWLIDWSVDWLIDWSVDRLIGRLIDWFGFFRLAEEDQGNNQMVEHFVAIMKELCVHGPGELRVQLSQSPFRLVSFQLPKPKGPPFSIRCVDVFQSLQDLFLKTTSQDAAKCVLLATNELFVWDEANYFIMDAMLNTLSLLTAKVALLNQEVQNIYFNLLRHIV